MCEMGFWERNARLAKLCAVIGELPTEERRNGVIALQLELNDIKNKLRKAISARSIALCQVRATLLAQQTRELAGCYHNLGDYYTGTRLSEVAERISRAALGGEAK
jgi:hypothetical protein